MIVTGLGKSGHVARKIAATFASTGTPAFFVHAAEASHGDLGMITADDVIMALSWSGEQPEMKNLITYAKRFRIALIAMTADPDSTLGTAADVALTLPKAREACPHNLAPTTSSLMLLALGDALAIALLEGRGFTSVDFSVLHPGGKLGAMLKFIRDLMHAGDAVPLRPLGTPMSDALVEMTSKGFGCVGIVDARGHIVGIVTDGDLRRHMRPDLMTALVDDVMTKNPKTIGRDLLASEALEILNSSKITALIVTDARQAGRHRPPARHPARRRGVGAPFIVVAAERRRPARYCRSVALRLYVASAPGMTISFGNRAAFSSSGSAESVRQIRHRAIEAAQQHDFEDFRVVVMRR